MCNTHHEEMFLVFCTGRTPQILERKAEFLRNSIYHMDNIYLVATTSRRKVDIFSVPEWWKMTHQTTFLAFQQSNKKQKNKKKYLTKKWGGGMAPVRPLYRGPCYEEVSKQKRSCCLHRNDYHVHWTIASPIRFFYLLLMLVGVSLILQYSLFRYS